MVKRYDKHKHIFAVGLIAVWIFLNLVFFRFEPESRGFQIITGILAVIEISYLLIPSLFNAIYDGWTFIAKKIGQFNTHLLLSLIFYLIFTPVSLVMRLLGKDLLDRKIEPERPSYWHPRPDTPKTIQDYKKLF